MGESLGVVPLSRSRQRDPLACRTGRGWGEGGSIQRSAR
jgi:hypothetical protein